MTNKVKFPKTWHVPWSIGSSDDKTLKDDSHMQGMHVVATLKLDGENTTLANTYMHARSLEHPNHPSQSWVKQLWGNMAYKIPDGYRYHGENVYAKHTIAYDSLKTYFYLFGVSVDNIYVSWTMTKILAKINELEVVPVIYEGVYDAKAIEEAFAPYKDKHEGYVIRNSAQFPLSDYNKNVAKYVNAGFRQTLKENNIHWASAPVIPNKLKNDE